MNRIIKTYTAEIISPDDMVKIYNKILKANIGDKKKRKEHITRINKNISNNKRTAGEICPRCGGQLVEKRGRYGMFTGCANYPRCKFVPRK